MMPYRAQACGVIATMALIVLVAGENPDALVRELPELNSKALGDLLVKRGMSDATWGESSTSKSVDQVSPTAVELNLAETMWSPAEEFAKINEPEPGDDEFIAQAPGTKAAKKAAKKAKKKAKKAAKKKKAKAKKAAKKAKKAAKKAK